VPFGRSVSFTGIKIRIHCSTKHDANQLATVIENFSPPEDLADCVYSVTPQLCSVTHGIFNELEIAGEQRVVALDLPETSLLVWRLFPGDSKEYLVFGKKLNGVYHYVTFYEDRTFWFAKGSDPNEIDLSGNITDPRVFYLGSGNQLVIACKNSLTACLNLSSRNIDAAQNGDGWDIDFNN